MAKVGEKRIKDAFIYSDLSGTPNLTVYALKTNVLGLDNDSVFTPDNDYEPATKKYVDDLIYAKGVHHSKACTYISGTGTAGVDNTAQAVKTVTLLANSLLQVNDRMRIRVYWTGTTGIPVTGTTTLNGVTISHTTDGGAATLQINEVWLHYVDNTHANIIEVEDGGLGVLSAPNVAGFDWDSNQDIVISQDAIINNHIVVYALIVDVFPKGSL